MDLTQLANLGEFIGGFAVLVTLIYLALQMRQNTQLTSAQLRQEITRLSTEVAFRTRIDELNYLGKAMADPDSLPRDQLRHACARFMGITNFYETLFYARERGEVDDEFWESRCVRLANLVGPAEHSLWPMMKDCFGQSFQDFVDKEILAGMARDRASWLNET